MPRLLPAAALAGAFLLGASGAHGQVITAQQPVKSAVINPASITIQPLPPRAGALQARLSPALSSPVRAWVQSEAAVIAGKSLSPDALLLQAKNDVTARFAGQKMLAADVDAMVIMVLTAAANSAQDDLKNLMDGVKLANSRKSSARPGVSKADALTDMSSEQQMRMQMYMDRRAKLESTLSNLLKKSSETASQITQNLK
jgi:hypothetical protein